MMERIEVASENSTIILPPLTMSQEQRRKHREYFSIFEGPRALANTMVVISSLSADKSPSLHHCHPRCHRISLHNGRRAKVHDGAVDHTELRQYYNDEREVHSYRVKANTVIQVARGMDRLAHVSRFMLLPDPLYQRSKLRARSAGRNPKISPRPPSWLTQPAIIEMTPPILLYRERDPGYNSATPPSSSFSSQALCKTQANDLRVGMCNRYDWIFVEVQVVLV